VKVLITGADGQLGRALCAAAPSDWVVVRKSRQELDVTNPGSVEHCLTKERPEWVLNAAAFTAVDRAESEPAAAQAVNATGPALLARASSDCGGRMLHISTDFVFDGQGSTPYSPESEPAPINVYGASKLAGERAVRLETAGDAVLVRTSWVYSSEGTSFVLRMLELMRTRTRIEVVVDQVGSPTWAHSLADCIWDLVRGNHRGGIYHWTDAGVASWYDFAVAIQEEALARGLLQAAVPVRPIRSAEFPAAARRPAYSVLDTRVTVATLGRAPHHWRANLRRMLDELAQT
jgi:dTDP-4-dehydrorhamnose reductase